MSEFPQALPDREKRDATIAELIAGIRRDLSFAQSKITDLTAALDDLDLAKPIPRRNLNGPVTVETCPGCGIAVKADTHADDCPTRPRGPT